MECGKDEDKLIAMGQGGPQACVIDRTTGVWSGAREVPTTGGCLFATAPKVQVTKNTMPFFFWTSGPPATHQALFKTMLN